MAHFIIFVLVVFSVACSNDITSPTKDDNCKVRSITLKEEKIYEWRTINGRETLITIWQPATKIPLCND